MTDELIGKKIGGYEIVEVIGRGGMATVYSAHQVSMNRTVALKVLPRHFLNDETYLQRFHREVKIVSQLEHRNIVPVYDYGEQDSQPYIAMRFMSGGSVDDLLDDGPLPLDLIVRILDQIAPALDYAHTKTVLHRDLKPSNVLMDDDGGAYLTDFGIARILSETGGTITTQGVVGTPSYMSPEQAQGQALDGRSDLYSLGVMLFEMATARRPFESDTPYSIAVMQVTTPPPMPRTINPELPPSVEQVILTALKKRREERYNTAVALVEALKQAIKDASVSLSDTQPGIPRPYVPPIPPPVAPVAPPSQYVYTPAPQSYPPPTPGGQIAALPRVRQRRRPNLFISAIIGAVIGCGLLSVLVLVSLLLIDYSNQQEAILMQTATIEAAQTQAQTTLEGTPGASGQGTFGEDIATSAPPAATTEPAPASTQTAQPPSSVTQPPTDGPTPVTGVAPVGVRASSADIDVNGAVLFFAERDGNFDIFRLNLPSLTEIQLTDNVLADTYPAVSPDGSRIAFQSDRDGDFDIYVMEANGNNTRRIVQNRVTDRIPSWSPDGQWLIFSSDTLGDGNFDLYRVRPDGSDLQAVFSDGTRNSHARWSADNHYIIFTSGKNDDATTWEIRRYDMHSEEVAFLTINNVKDWSPAFAPDGEHILYLTNGNGFAAIAEMNMDGEDVRVVYDGAGYESEASYSPDGDFIVFTSNVSGTDQLYLMTANGDTIQQLTTRGGVYPTWFPPSE
jgi:serine/threonine protein kinase